VFLNGDQEDYQVYDSINCIFDDSPLGFENSWSYEVGKLEA